MYYRELIHTLTHNKMLDLSKMKNLQTTNVTKILFFHLLSRKHCGKVENAGYKHFLECFLNFFETFSSLESLKSLIVW